MPHTTKLLIQRNYTERIEAEKCFINPQWKSSSNRFINQKDLAFFTYLESGNSMQRKTVPIQESIPIEIYNELLDFGNGMLKDGIQNAVFLAHTMKEIQNSQTNEADEIWRRII